MAFDTTSQALYTILSGLTGSGKLLSRSYDYPEPIPDDFPAAYPVIAQGSHESPETSAQSDSVETFAIRVLTDAKYTSAKWRRFMQAIDAIKVELRKEANQTIAGAWRLEVSPAIVPIYDPGMGRIFGADIIVTAHILVSNS